MVRWGRERIEGQEELWSYCRVGCMVERRRNGNSLNCYFSTRGEGGEVHSKKELIQMARMIAKESEEVVKMARKVADVCTDKRMKRVGLSSVCYVLSECCYMLKYVNCIKSVC